MSLIAQWMMARKILENWLIWIAVDFVYIGMFLYKSLYLTALLLRRLPGPLDNGLPEVEAIVGSGGIRSPHPPTQIGGWTPSGRHFIDLEPTAGS